MKRKTIIHLWKLLLAEKHKLKRFNIYGAYNFPNEKIPCWLNIKTFFPRKVDEIDDFVSWLVDELILGHYDNMWQSRKSRMPGEKKLSEKLFLLCRIFLICARFAQSRSLFKTLNCRDFCTNLYHKEYYILYNIYVDILPKKIFLLMRSRGILVY